MEEKMSLKITEKNVFVGEKNIIDASIKGHSSRVTAEDLSDLNSGADMIAYARSHGNSTCTC